MTDRHKLETSLRNAMAYQGYMLVRDPDASSERQASDGYMVLRRAETVLGGRNYDASLESVRDWADSKGVGQPHLWHGNRKLPSEEEEEGTITEGPEEVVPDPGPDDERLLLEALKRYFGALDSQYDSEARLAALREDREKVKMPLKKHYKSGERARKELVEKVATVFQRRS